MDSEAVDDMAGPLLKPLGVEGPPFSEVGEWLLPLSTEEEEQEEVRRGVIMAEAKRADMLVSFRHRTSELKVRGLACWGPR